MKSEKNWFETLLTRISAHVSVIRRKDLGDVGQFMLTNGMMLSISWRDIAYCNIFGKNPTFEVAIYDQDDHIVGEPHPYLEISEIIELAKEVLRK